MPKARHITSTGKHIINERELKIGDKVKAKPAHLDKWVSGIITAIHYSTNLIEVKTKNESFNIGSFWVIKSHTKEKK